MFSVVYERIHLQFIPIGGIRVGNIMSLTMESIPH